MNDGKCILMIYGKKHFKVFPILIAFPYAIITLVCLTITFILGDCF